MAVQHELTLMIDSDKEITSCNKDKHEPCQSCLVDENSSEKKFTRLVERILVRGVVPFLGAGLSLKSRGPRNKTIACTRTMTCSVCHTLPGKSPENRCRKGRKKCCGMRGSDSMRKSFCGKRRGLGDICEEYLWEVGQQEDLVYNVLQIQDFTCLEITNAHRYIAYLARESVIEEVITSIMILHWKEPTQNLCALNTSIGRVKFRA